MHTVIMEWNNLTISIPRYFSIILFSVAVFSLIGIEEVSALYISSPEVKDDEKFDIKGNVEFRKAYDNVSVYIVKPSGQMLQECKNFNREATVWEDKSFRVGNLKVTDEWDEFGTYKVVGQYGDEHHTSYFVYMPTDDKIYPEPLIEDIIPPSIPEIPQQIQTEESDVETKTDSEYKPKPVENQFDSKSFSFIDVFSSIFNQIFGR